MALLMSLYISTVVTSTLKKKKETSPPAPSAARSCTEHLHPTGRPAAMDAARARGSSHDELRQTAEDFDKGLRFPEWWMGITGLREDLAALARGHVLEVAVGTGRNLVYYDWSGVVASVEGGGADDSKTRKQEEERLRSFTGVDISGDMMGVARDRLREAVPGLKKVMRRRRAEPFPDKGGPVVEMLDGRVRLVIGDAQEELPAPAETIKDAKGKYDTVIQTFGLCSVGDPAKLLGNMASAVKPDTGRIILLEHGRGWWDWVNNLLDRFAAAHFQKYGCWWNRDIERLVRDAAATVPGLEVMRAERPLLLQFGTTMFFELRVKSEASRGSNVDTREKS